MTATTAYRMSPNHVVKGFLFMADHGSSYVCRDDEGREIATVLADSCGYVRAFVGRDDDKVSRFVKRPAGRVAGWAEPDALRDEAIAWAAETLAAQGY